MTSGAQLEAARVAAGFDLERRRQAFAIVIGGDPMNPDLELPGPGRRHADDCGLDVAKRRKRAHVARVVATIASRAANLRGSVAPAIDDADGDGCAGFGRLTYLEHRARRECAPDAPTRW